VALPGARRDIIACGVVLLVYVVVAVMVDFEPTAMPVVLEPSRQALEKALVGVALAAALAAVVAVRRTRESKRAYAGRAAAEMHQAVLFDETPQPMWVVENATLRFLAVNRAAIERYGYTRDEFLAMSVMKVSPEEDRVIAEASVHRPAAGIRRNPVFRHVRKNGEERLVQIDAHPVKYDGRPARLVVATDVTERERALAGLRENHALLASVIEGTSDYIYAKDRDGRYVLVNSAAASASDHTIDEIRGHTDRELFGAQFAAPIEADDARALAGESRSFEQRFAYRGQDRMLLTTKVPRRSGDGSIVGIIGVAHDVTAMRRIESEARAKDATFRGFFEAPGAYQCVYDLAEGADDFVITLPNAKIADYYGIPEDRLAGMTGRQAGLSEPNVRVWVDRLRKCQAAGVATTFEYQAELAGDPRWFLASLSPMRVRDSGPPSICFAAHEITMRKQLEEQLLRAQKLEAVGQLAGGIAHDFNNLLTVILSHARFLEPAVSDERARSDVAQIARAAERAATLTRQLLAFARRQVFEPQVLDLNSLLRDMEKMVRPLLGARVRLVLQLEAHLGSVQADPGQIEQVIVNLALNARDAMTQGGILTIETANHSLDGARADANPDVPPGSYVVVSVHDSGDGIPDDVLPHVFEPFYTTKARGVGTGLGLSSSFGIIKQSGGHITLHTERGRGTTVRCYFPRVNVEATPRVAARLSPPPRGSETVLVVEDNPLVRKIAVRVLALSGYRVLESEDGEQALEVAAGCKTPIDLLLTDVVMPKVGGPELAERLKQIRPGMRVLYTSGYTEAGIVHEGTLDAGLSFLAKPYLPDDLVRRVREVLDARRS
jgi:two-component system cell cycle sensor histidine kinase/response regulator CckA